MQIIYKKINDLIPYVNNPRKNDGAVDVVASSIKNFGFKVPIVLDGQNEIVTGHTRLKAAQKLGLEEVPCIIADDLTPAQIKAFRLADNKVSEFAEWDFELINIELDSLDGFNMTNFGFELGFDEMLEEVIDDDFDVDKAIEDIKEPTGKAGDVWKLGRHRLMCGDSTKAEDVEKLMAGQKVDLYLTDPPYNVAYEGKTKDALTIQNDNMSNDTSRQFLVDAFSAADNAMKSGVVFYIWHADLEGYNFRAACVDVGWQVRQCLIWNKNLMVMGWQDYHSKHEPCLYGWKAGSGHLWAADRKQTTILNFDRPNKNGEHPTMKPVALFDYQIKNSTKAEDMVLDTFAGSGTTIIACEQNGRNAYCMELDPKYCDVIINRWETLSGLFAQQTRDGILTENENAKAEYFSDIFSEVTIKQGDAAKGFWSLEGSEEKNYLVTSPGGTSTGIGANYILVDDIIKNGEEANNEMAKEKHWEWYNNTLVQRMERPRKQILIMTRWASDDLVGMMLENKKDKCHLITYKAVQEDGSMLCDEIMTKAEYEDTIAEMGKDIASANYQQEPIDLKG